jgi:hypothetical protein
MMAQLSPDMVKEIPAWLVCFGALLWIYNEGSRAVKELRGKPGRPPNEELKTSHDNLVERVAKLETELSGIRGQMLKDYQNNQDQASTRSAGIYRKMDELRLELTRRIEEVRKELADNQETLPERLVSLLKNTGAIGR